MQHIRFTKWLLFNVLTGHALHAQSHRHWQELDKKLFDSFAKINKDDPAVVEKRILYRDGKPPL